MIARWALFGFGVIIVPVLTFLYFFIFDPIKFDAVFSAMDPSIMQKEYIIGSKLSRDGIIDLNKEFNEFNNFCIFGTGFNPIIEIKGKENFSLVTNIGPLFMGSDRDWHIALINEREPSKQAVIVAVNRYYFPYSMQSGCFRHVKIVKKPGEFIFELQLGQN